MSEWLNKVFSGGVSLARVNPVGIALMAAAVVLIVVAALASGRWTEKRCNLVRIAGLLSCALGAIVAII